MALFNKSMEPDLDASMEKLDASLHSIVKDCSPRSTEAAIEAYKLVLVFLLARLYCCDLRESLFSMLFLMMDMVKGKQ